MVGGEWVIARAWVAGGLLADAESGWSARRAVDRHGGRTDEQAEKRISARALVNRRGEQIRKTQDEPQWIVAQGLLSALTIPGFS